MASHFDNIYYHSGGRFPYHRYVHGSAHVVDHLNYLINEYTPDYDEDGFKRELIERKVKSRMKDGSIFDFFEAGPKNKPQPEDWKYNSIVDYYTDTSRMASVGYGRKESPLQFWEHNTYNGERRRIFHGKKTLHEAREAIYQEFKTGEVRLAYVTDCIGLLNHLKQFLAPETPRMLDITAFGDRLIGAAATGFDYTGVDPDPNLVDGINRLTLDVQSIKRDFRCTTHTLPMEHYAPNEKFDLITLSPPPFNMELYEGGSRQTHRVYRDFRHWFYGFIRETLTRASLWLKEGGILAFSVLDREGPNNIQYTEAMILMAMYLGFKPLQIYTLSSSAGTPWWVFEKSDESNDLILDLYPELVVNRGITLNKSPAMEYIRLQTQRYLVKQLENSKFFSRPEKTTDILGRMFMSRTPSPDEPDVLFMDGQSDYIINEEDFNKDWIPKPFIFQTSDQGYRTVIYPEDKSMSEILNSIFDAITSYLHWIQCTVQYETFERKTRVSRINSSVGNFVNLYIENRDAIGTMHFLRSQTFFSEEELDKVRIVPKYLLLWSTRDPNADVRHISSWIRYDAVGIVGHHYTRPESRINAIKEISQDDKVVDLFATPTNANSEYYTSVYPDVDPKSLGNFFSYDGSGFETFMANPPAYNAFNEKVYDRLKEIYLDKGKKLFYSTTIWEDNGAKYLDRLRKKQDPGFDDLENYFLPTTLMEEPTLVAIYILSSKLHPSYDAVNKKTLPNRKSESVGFIFGKKSDFDLSKLDLLSEGAHYIL